MSKTVIAVVGSAMIDLTAYAKVIPAPGQTIEGDLLQRVSVVKEPTKPLLPHIAEPTFTLLES